MNGTFVGDVRLRVVGVWKEEVEDRMKQLKGGAIIELKMYRMIGKMKTVSRENIDIDFNEDNGDILSRTTTDRAGERGLDLGKLELLIGKDKIVVGLRQEGKVLKMEINTTALRDVWEQINKRCEEWAEGIHTWGSRVQLLDSGQEEEEINAQNEDEVYQAKAVFVYGFTEEATRKMKNETLVEIVIAMAKMGIKGDITCKREDLERRVRDKEHKFTTGNFGIYGGREAKFGVMVEFFSNVRVGITGGAGIMVYDGRRYDNEGERMQLSRQYISEKEMEMMKRTLAGKQDNLVCAARGMIYKASLDDVLRRSFKT